MRIIDMHIHSTFSDGSHTPEQIARAAHRKGLSLAALTDHDTTAGIEAFRSACEAENVPCLGGIELSAAAKYTLHILGYRISSGCKELEERLEYVRAMRNVRNEQMIEKLQRIGFDITMEEVLQEAKCDVPARPHIANLLVKKGYAENYRMAFSHYLGKGGAAYVSRIRLEPEECINLIKQAGGLAVLAHPAQCMLTDEHMEELLDRLKDAGLWGIEAVYASHTPEMTRSYLRLAERFGLYATAGSDFHGINKPGIDLGMIVKDDFLPWARLDVRQL